MKKTIVISSLGSVAAYAMVSKMSALPDSRRFEGLLAGGVIVAGATNVLNSKYGTEDDPDAKPPVVGISLMVGGIGYSFSRSILKASPKSSFGLSLVLAIASSFLVFAMKKNEKVKEVLAEISGGEVEYEHDVVYDSNGRIKKIVSVQK